MAKMKKSKKAVSPKPTELKKMVPHFQKLGKRASKTLAVKG